MTPKITRKEYNLIAEQRGIKDPQNMSKEELLNTLSRYNSKHEVKKIHKKLSKIGLEKIAKIQNISKKWIKSSQKAKIKKKKKKKINRWIKRDC